MSDQEEQLLIKSVSGDRAALGELLRLCAPALRATVAESLDAKWRSVLDEDDVLQVTYIEAFSDISRMKPQGMGGFVQWLRRMAKNNVRDAVRGLDAAKRPNPARRVQAKAANGDEAGLDLLESLGAYSTTPSRVAAAREANQWLSGVLRTLPDDYRMVVQMLDLDQKPVSEVATAMKRSQGAVFMLRARAYERLRRLLPTASSFLMTRV